MQKLMVNLFWYSDGIHLDTPWGSEGLLIWRQFWWEVVTQNTHLTVGLSLLMYRPFEIGDSVQLTVRRACKPARSKICHSAMPWLRPRRLRNRGPK